MNNTTNTEIKTTLVEKFKNFVKHFLFYFVFILSLTAGFAIGYNYNTIKSCTVKTKPDIVLRNEVTIAIDESNNILIINKKTGSYTTYQDSIGGIIFNFYAKNIWGEHNISK